MPLQIIFFCTIYLYATQLQPGIQDLGDMFTREQKEELDVFIKNVFIEEGLTIHLVTINTLGGQALRDSSYRWVEVVQLNSTLRNESALIYLVKKERKLDLHLGLGLEWDIPEERANLIKRTMIEQFKYGNFVAGIKDGVDLLIEFRNDINHTIDFADYQNFKDNQHLAINRKVTFGATAVSKTFNRSKITREQFSEKYFIYVHAPDDQLVKLKFSRNALSLIDRFLELKSGKVFGKVSSTNPLDIQLFGIEL